MQADNVEALEYSRTHAAMRSKKNQSAFGDMHFHTRGNDVPQRLRRSGKIALRFGYALPLGMCALARYLSTRMEKVAARISALNVSAVASGELNLKPFVSDQLAGNPFKPTPLRGAA